jgi:hypothetical protein
MCRTDRLFRIPRELVARCLVFPGIPTTARLSYFFNCRELACPLLAAVVDLAPRGSDFADFTLSHNLTDPVEVYRVMDEALTAGAKLLKPAQEAFWGSYSGCFTDPDGFVREVAHVPQFWIGPKPEDEA